MVVVVRIPVGSIVSRDADIYFIWLRVQLLPSGEGGGAKKSILCSIFWPNNISSGRIKYDEISINLMKICCGRESGMHGRNLSRPRSSGMCVCRFVYNSSGRTIKIKMRWLAKHDEYDDVDEYARAQSSKQTHNNVGINCKETKMRRSYAQLIKTCLFLFLSMRLLPLLM